MTGLDVGRTLERWLDLLEEEHVLLGSREVTMAELAGWLELVEAAADGDKPSRRELDKLVAFHARSQGMEGVPASATALRVRLLEVALAEAGEPTRTRTTPLLRWLLRVAADAHSLGMAEHLESQHHHEIRGFSPLLRLDGETVVAFMLGPMTADIIDSITGRLLRDCAATGAKTAILDVLGAAADEDRFHRTIKAILESEPGQRIQLVIAGLRDPAGTRSALQAIGADLSRLQLVDSSSSFLLDRSNGLR